MRGQGLKRIAVLALAMALAVLVYVLWPRQQPQAGGPAFEAAELLADEEAGFARAVEVREFVFPADHGAHPDYRNEWWYFTGNLEDAAGRAFGFEFTVFRFAMMPEPIERASNWASRQLYMAHFAVTDIDGERFYAAERFARGAMGLAGAQAAPFKVWLEDWQVSAEADEAFPARLQAATDEAGLDLRLEALQPPVLQGDRGLSPKGAGPGNASYYFSMPRLAAAGEVRFGGERYEVKGQAWLDREWGSSVLERGQAGWDWFSLQFDNGAEMMVFQLRREDGSTDPYNAGMWIAADGSTRPLRAQEFELEPLATWESLATGVEYPLRWRLRIPALNAELTVAPRLENQELDLSVRYWEGAIEVSGEIRNENVRGLGYMELTGYE